MMNANIEVDAGIGESDAYFDLIYTREGFHVDVPFCARSIEMQYSLCGVVAGNFPSCTDWDLVRECVFVERDDRHLQRLLDVVSFVVGEKKIDEMIESKNALAGKLIDSTENKWITEMSNEDE